MTVRGIEAIKLQLPATNAKLDINIREEQEKQTTQATQVINIMTSVERYSLEWRQLLSILENKFEHIRDLAFNGELKVSKFRSIFWSLLLRVLNDDFKSWREQRKLQRQRYEKLKHEFVKNPHEFETPNDDPLSQSKQSAWNQYFSDQELFAVIRQDVIRTFPGVDFFRKQIIQTAMTNILFYYAREHPYMSYRQGMHEILAPILFVMFADHQALLHFKEIAKTEIDEILLNVINPDYLEADSYSIFSRLMSSIESYYRITNLVQTPSGYFPVIDEHSNAISTEVEVIGQLNSIRDNILAKEDLHLHNYLVKLDIPLHIFGIRWLRLLFGREFPLLDLLVLWDAIFADSDHFDLPNYILVAMLIRIRDKLLLNDYTTCLTFLMRYPTNVDINLILRHALHMQMPKKFDCPANAFVYFTMKPNTAATTLSNLSQAITTPAQPKKLQATNVAPKQSIGTGASASHLNAEALRQRERSTSLGSSGAQIEHQINMLQARNAADAAAMARLCAAPETDRVIMDGYSANSPELMRLELRNAQTVITVARGKLLKYLETVHKHLISTHRSDELLQALDGIEELCSFLDVKFIFPIQARATPIDQALEANENQRQATFLSPPCTLKIEINSAAKTKFRKPDDTSTNNNLAMDKRINVSACEASTLEAGDLPPSGPIVINASAAIGTAYEKPDNGFMFNSHHILGNLKEIELMQIATDEKVVQPCSVLQQSEGMSSQNKNDLTTNESLVQQHE